MWAYRNQNEVEFIQEISELSDRLIGILAPIILDERITSAIKHRWVDNSLPRAGTTILKDLFRPTGGEMAPFGTKVRIGLAIGLYGLESYADLVLIEKTRNAFAHRLDVKSFEDQPVRDFVRNISISKRWPEERPLPLTLGDHYVVVPDSVDESDPSTLRGKFLMAVATLSHLLYHESHVRRPDPRIPAF